jgi:high-affinity Fe2+/Pb2+ permease
MQGIGWLSRTPSPFAAPFWMGPWLGFYPTWEAVAAQLASLVFVLGSYAVARELQGGRRRRASLQAAERVT